MDTKIVNPKTVHSTRLVKSEDLNHHGTLFAGRTAEWFVEAGFIAAASIFNPKNVVCLKIHGMFFTEPARPGNILKFESKVVYTGKSSIISHIKVLKEGSDNAFVSGFITFIHVDDSTCPSPHGIEIQPVTDEEKELNKQARELKK